MLSRKQKVFAILGVTSITVGLLTIGVYPFLYEAILKSVSEKAAVF